MDSEPPTGPTLGPVGRFALLSSLGLFSLWHFASLPTPSPTKCAEFPAAPSIVAKLVGLHRELPRHSGRNQGSGVFLDQTVE